MNKDLFDSFTSTDKNDWIKAAQIELKGASPLEKLTKVTQGLEIKPYYDSSDVENMSDFRLDAAQESFLGPRSCFNMPLVTVQNVQIANQIALGHLNMGADGILFKLESKIDAQVLLKDIELPYCSIFYLADNDHIDFLLELAEFVKARKFDQTLITGGVFWNDAIPEPVMLASMFQDWDRFSVLGHSVIEGSPVEAIKKALVLGVNSIDHLTTEGFPLENAISCQAFSLDLGKDFFVEIAKLKALRILWNQVIMAYGASSKQPFVPFIHGLSQAWKDESYQPNSNMLKSTTTAIAALAGGCDGLTVVPENEGHLVESRIARNVLTILREESYLNRTADPTAGSYYLESLTDQIARKAWSQFQESVQS